MYRCVRDTVQRKFAVIVCDKRYLFIHFTGDRTADLYPAQKSIHGKHGRHESRLHACIDAVGVDVSHQFDAGGVSAYYEDHSSEILYCVYRERIYGGRGKQHQTGEYCLSDDTGNASVCCRVQKDADKIREQIISIIAEMRKCEWIYDAGSIF